MTEITIGELSERSGVATSAIRYYEDLGLVSSRRTTGNQRRYERAMLRRLAFIRTAQRVGLSLRGDRDGPRHAAQQPHAHQGRLDPAQPRLAARGSTPRSASSSGCATRSTPASAADA